MRAQDQRRCHEFQENPWQRLQQGLAPDYQRVPRLTRLGQRLAYGSKRCAHVQARMLHA